MLLYGAWFEERESEIQAKGHKHVRLNIWVAIALIKITIFFKKHILEKSP